jgi:alkylation response protein AidB-like acyl-CoA dehydrogenase
MSGADHPVTGFEPGAERFRQEVCTFLESEMAADRTAGHADPTDRTGLDEAFERALLRRAGKRGYLGIGLPPEVGGGGRPPSFVAAFQYEVAYHHAPLVDTAVTLAAVPVIEFGDPDQQAALLPQMVAGEIEMCIAYTEPAAGNDLTGLTTTATVEGDGFVLEGTKTLITGAGRADHCLTVAITDPAVAPRKGMSMFVVDMRAPGVSVIARPTMARYCLWDVRFDRVDLAAGALLGRRDQGWPQLSRAVEAERNAMFSLGWCQRSFDDLLAELTATGRLDDPLVADTVAQLWIDLRTGWRVSLSLLDPGASRVAASIAKVHLTELAQRLAQAATELSGPAGAIEGSPFTGAGPDGAAGRFCYEYLFRVDGPISVGANELHRTGIAQGGLGLPRR